MIRLSFLDQKIPTEVAAYVMERNVAFPDAHFEIGHFPVRDVDRPREKEGMRALREKYSRTFFPKSPGPFAVLGVNFLYGQETWTVRIIGGVDEDGNIRTAQTIDADKELLPLPSKLRNEIAGFDPALFECIEVQAAKGPLVIYGEPRTTLMAFREHPESFVQIDPKYIF